MNQPITTNVRGTHKQLAVLVLIYRFRFVNSKKVQQELKQTYSQQTMELLSRLIASKYIARKRTGTDTLAGKPGAHYLLAKGGQAIKHKAITEAKVLRMIRHDIRAKETFIAHCITLGEIDSEFNRLYGDSCSFFTKSELRAQAYELYMPHSLPDAYVSLQTGKKAVRHLFIDYIEEHPLQSIARRKIRQYILYAESGEWQNRTGTPLPTMLIICDSDLLLKVLVPYTRRVLNHLDEDIDNLTFMFTTFAKLKEAKSRRTSIWQRINSEMFSGEDEVLK